MTLGNFRHVAVAVDIVPDKLWSTLSLLYSFCSYYNDYVMYIVVLYSIVLCSHVRFMDYNELCRMTDHELFSRQKTQP